MEDLGTALADKSTNLCMLGGGQPAYCPDMMAVFQEELQKIASSPERVQEVLGEYDPAAGNMEFRKALAQMFHELNQWDVTADNIGLAAGGQSACFHLMNALAGEGEHILVPLIPDYMGYRDQLVSGAEFMGIPGIAEIQEDFFRYRVDLEAVRQAPDSVRMMVLSRPTNPSGNVVTDAEVRALSEECKRRGIPLMIDHAYGEPFPNAVYVETESFWQPHHIHLYSCSKLGLPGARTAMVVACPQITQLLTNMTAVTSLANPNLAQALTLDLIKQRTLPTLSAKYLKPFYQEKCDYAVRTLKGLLADKVPYHLHAPEGAFFLWIYFPELPIPVQDLVERLKQNGVLVISGHWFFFGVDDNATDHQHKCLRMTYSMETEEVTKGLERLTDTLVEVHRSKV